MSATLAGFSSVPAVQCCFGVPCRWIALVALSTTSQSRSISSSARSQIESPYIPPGFRNRTRLMMLSAGSLISSSLYPFGTYWMYSSTRPYLSTAFSNVPGSRVTTPQMLAVSLVKTISWYPSPVRMEDKIPSFMMVSRSTSGWSAHAWTRSFSPSAPGSHSNVHFLESAKRWYASIPSAYRPPR